MRHSPSSTRKEDGREERVPEVYCAGRSIDAHLRELLATSYLEAGKIDEGRDELRKAAIIDPKSRAALSGLYLTYKESGDKAKTAEYEQKLRSIGVDPGQVTSAALGLAVPSDKTTTATSAATRTQPTTKPATATTQQPAAAQPVPQRGRDGVAGSRRRRPLGGSHRGHPEGAVPGSVGQAQVPQDVFPRPVIRSGSRNEYRARRRAAVCAHCSGA